MLDQLRRIWQPQQEEEEEEVLNAKEAWDHIEAWMRRIPHESKHVMEHSYNLADWRTRRRCPLCYQVALLLGESPKQQSKMRELWEKFPPDAFDISLDDLLTTDDQEDP